MIRPTRVPFPHFCLTLLEIVMSSISDLVKIFLSFFLFSCATRSAHNCVKHLAKTAPFRCSSCRVFASRCSRPRERERNGKKKKTPFFRDFVSYLPILVSVFYFSLRVDPLKRLVKETSGYLFFTSCFSLDLLLYFTRANSF